MMSSYERRSGRHVIHGHEVSFWRTRLHKSRSYKKLPRSRTRKRRRYLWRKPWGQAHADGRRGHGRFGGPLCSHAPREPQGRHRADPEPGRRGSDPGGDGLRPKGLRGVREPRVRQRRSLRARPIRGAPAVAIKERRTLILVPREAPLSSIMLDNLAKLAHAGVTVLPAMPGFYHNPKEVQQLVDFVVGRILDHLDQEHALYRPWEGPAKRE